MYYIDKEKETIKPTAERTERAYKDIYFPTIQEARLYREYIYKTELDTVHKIKRVHPFLENLRELYHLQSKWEDSIKPFSDELQALGYSMEDVLYRWQEKIKVESAYKNALYLMNFERLDLRDYRLKMQQFVSDFRWNTQAEVENGKEPTELDFIQARLEKDNYEAQLVSVYKQLKDKKQATIQKLEVKAANLYNKLAIYLVRDVHPNKRVNDLMRMLFLSFDYKHELEKKIEIYKQSAIAYDKGDTCTLRTMDIEYLKEHDCTLAVLKKNKLERIVLVNGAYNRTALLTSAMRFVRNDETVFYFPSEIQKTVYHDIISKKSLIDEEEQRIRGNQTNYNVADKQYEALYNRKIFAE